MKIFDLKAFRRDNGITQAELAVFFGCNQNFISRIEGGIRSIPADKLEILEAKYGDISKYYRERPSQKIGNINSGSNSNEPVAAHPNEAASGSELIVRMMNEKQIAPYGLLEDKDKQIERLNRQIGRLEAELEAAKRENARKGGRAECADVV